MQKELRSIVKEELQKLAEGATIPPLKFRKVRKRLETEHDYEITDWGTADRGNYIVLDGNQRVEFFLRGSNAAEIIVDGESIGRTRLSRITDAIVYAVESGTVLDPEYRSEKEKVREIIRKELKEFDVAQLPSANSVRGGYSKKVENKKDLDEDHLSDGDKRSLNRKLRDIALRAEGVDEFVQQSMELYGKDGKHSPKVLTTLDDMKCYSDVRSRLNRIANYLEDEYPNFEWTFKELI